VYTAAVALDDDAVFAAVKALTKAVGRLAKVVPDFNEQFGVVLDAARQVPDGAGVDVGETHGALRVDGRTKHRVTFEQLLHQADPKALGSDNDLWTRAQRAHHTRVNLIDRARTGI
jgi:hypothetical protein